MLFVINELQHYDSGTSKYLDNSIPPVSIVDQDYILYENGACGSNN